MPPALLKIARSSGSAPSVSDQEPVAEGRERGPEWYDESFQRGKKWRKHYTRSRYYPMWAVISDRILRAGVESVLDVGCGPGQMASLLRDRGLPRYLGMDFSPERVEWARKVCPEFDFVVADAFETDLFQTHDYDAIVCTEFLEHVEEDLAVIGKLRAGTRFYGSVPNFPFESHVRHFSSAGEVHERYKDHFESLTVDEFRGQARGRVFYLIEGVKR